MTKIVIAICTLRNGEKMNYENKKIYLKPVITITKILIEDVVLASKVSDSPLDIFDGVDEEL